MNILADSLSYLFNPLPGKNFLYMIPLAVISALLLITGVLLSGYIKRLKSDKAFRRLFRSYPKKLITLGLLFLLYVLSRQYLVAFLGMRFMLLILGAVTVYILTTGIYSYLNKYPREKQKLQEQVEKNRYIPRKNHK